MYQIGICDDGENICSFFYDVILQYAKREQLCVNVEKWYTGEELRDFLAAGNSLDVLFLDVMLFELDGIEVGRFIRNQLDNHNMQIVFISGKTDYAKSLFQVQPMEFLVKPVADVQIEQVMDLAIKLIDERDGRYECRIGKDYFCLPYRNIMYFLSSGRRIKIMCTGETWKTKEDQKVEFYGKIKDVLKELPSSFLQVHQSYIINTTFVLRYEYEQVELVDGTLIPISKPYRKIVRNKILHEE